MNHMMMPPLHMEQTQTHRVTVGLRALPPRTARGTCPSQTAAAGPLRMTVTLNSNVQHLLVN